MEDLTPGMPIQRTPDSAPLPNAPAFDTGSAPQPRVGADNAVTDAYHSGTLQNESGVPLNGVPGSSAPKVTAVDAEQSGPTPLPPGKPIFS